MGWEFFSHFRVMFSECTAECVKITNMYEFLGLAAGYLFQINSQGKLFVGREHEVILS